MEHISNLNKKYVSILLALLICAKSINSIIGMVYSGSVPVGMVVLGAIWGAFLIYVLFNRAAIALTIRSFMFLLLIAVYLVFSLVIVGGYASELTLDFIEYGLLGFLIGRLDFDIEKTTMYICYMLLIMAIPFYIMMRNSMAGNNGAVIMTVSYSILPVALAVLTHFVYFRKKEPCLIVSYIFAFIFAVYLIFNGTRGGVLCFAMLIFLIMMNTKRSLNKTHNYKTAAAVLIIVFLAMNINSILIRLNDLLTSRGIYINFIQKSVKLFNSTDDVSNGRAEIYAIALQGFRNSPIRGNGVGAFGNLHYYHKYPHNIFLQALYEGGLILGIPIIYLTVRSVYEALFGKIKNDNFRIATILFVCSSVPAVMVSGEFWDYQILWALFGLFLRKDFMSRNKNADEGS